MVVAKFRGRDMPEKKGKKTLRMSYRDVVKWLIKFLCV